MTVSDPFSIILDETQEAVRLYIAARGVPLAEVDDVAQDVYMEFYKAQERRPPEVEPIRWLKGMARFHCLRWFQRHGQTGKFLAEIDEASVLVSSPMEEDDAADEVLHALRACVAKLPERSRGLLAQYYGDDEAFDRASSGVRMAVLRLRDVLRQCLRARGHGAGA